MLLVCFTKITLIKRIGKFTLYLETGTIPIKWVIAQRRINFLKHIVTRNEKELIRKIYSAQKENPSQGDFVSLVESDLKMVGLTQEEVTSASISKLSLKKVLAQKARNAAFAELMSQLQKGSKGKNMKYDKLQLQEYLKSEVLSEKEKNIITAVRTKCARGVRNNFPGMHKVCKHCPLNCNPVEPHIDTQEHVLECAALGGQSEVPLVFMFAGAVDQAILAKEFLKRMNLREHLQEVHGNLRCSFHLPGVSPDQRTCQGAAAV